MVDKMKNALFEKNLHDYKKITEIFENKFCKLSTSQYVMQNISQTIGQNMIPKAIAFNNKRDSNDSKILQHKQNSNNNFNRKDFEINKEINTNNIVEEQKKYNINSKNNNNNLYSSNKKDLKNGYQQNLKENKSKTMEWKDDIQNQTYSLCEQKTGKGKVKDGNSDIKGSNNENNINLVESPKKTKNKKTGNKKKNISSAKKVLVKKSKKTTTKKTTTKKTTTKKTTTNKTTTKKTTTNKTTTNKTTTNKTTANNTTANNTTIDVWRNIYFNKVFNIEELYKIKLNYIGNFNHIENEENDKALKFYMKYYKCIFYIDEKNNEKMCLKRNDIILYNYCIFCVKFLKLLILYGLKNEGNLININFIHPHIQNITYTYKCAKKHLFFMSLFHIMHNLWCPHYYCLFQCRKKNAKNCVKEFFHLKDLDIMEKQKNIFLRAKIFCSFNSNLIDRIIKNAKNPWEVLQINDFFEKSMDDKAELKKKARKNYYMLALKVHPDKNNSTYAPLAMNILSNSIKCIMSI
ncbi:DnaJ protein, putative [Hepatocystis sp. ex Piliocolobus tephrosceles]|nr:DnaJ protein, putative [Hepatocystis sp. ex Piliocolobus tephrosceles]